jgi:hypothetical protein
VHRKVPSKRPNITFSEQVNTAYTKVFLKPIDKDGSEKKVLKFSRPINCQSVRFHLVKLKNNDIPVGTKKNKEYIIPAGSKKT